MLFLLLQILPRSFFQSTYAYVYRHAKNTWGRLHFVPHAQVCRTDRTERASISFSAISASPPNAAYQFRQENYLSCLRASKPNGLVEFFAESPLAKAKIELEREPDYGREV